MSSMGVGTSQRARVMCYCPKCLPGKEVSLRTRQAHNQQEDYSQIREIVYANQKPLERGGGNDGSMDSEPLDNGSDMDIEPFDGSHMDEIEPLSDPPDEHWMDGVQGFRLVIAKLNFRG